MGTVAMSASSTDGLIGRANPLRTSPGRHALWSVLTLVGAYVVVLAIHLAVALVTSIVTIIGGFTGLGYAPPPAGIDVGGSGIWTVFFLLVVVASFVVVLLANAANSVLQLPITSHYVGDPYPAAPPDSLFLFVTPRDLWFGPEVYYLLPPLILAWWGATLAPYRPKRLSRLPRSASSLLAGAYMAPWYLLFCPVVYTLLTLWISQTGLTDYVGLSLETALVIGVVYPTVFGGLGGGIRYTYARVRRGNGSSDS